MIEGFVTLFKPTFKVYPPHVTIPCQNITSVQIRFFAYKNVYLLFKFFWWLNVIDPGSNLIKQLDIQTTYSHFWSYPPTPLHTHIPRLSSFIIYKTGVDELNDLLLNYSRIFDHLVYLNIRKSFGALYRMQNKVLCLFNSLNYSKGFLFQNVNYTNETQTNMMFYSITY
jgi:hypothetical protein